MKQLLFVLPILEYCCLNKFCNPCQCTFIGSNEWYHILASPSSVKQNIWTLTSSTKWCAVIQSLVQSRWASTSSSGFHENSGLKWDQCKCTTGYAGCCGTCSTAGSAASVGGLGARTFYSCGPGFAISYLYLVYVKFQIKFQLTIILLFFSFTIVSMLPYCLVSFYSLFSLSFFLFSFFPLTPIFLCILSQFIIIKVFFSTLCSIFFCPLLLNYL